MSLLRGYLADESGQTFVEWLGVIVFVIALLGVVAAFVPGLGADIAHVARKAIESVGV
jgi:Flp pilus assembly pilin Flp